MNHSTDGRRVHADGAVALWLTGLAFAAIHIAFSGRYGFHRDELLSYSNAMHLDWCYVVYPPLTAWLARAELTVFARNTAVEQADIEIRYSAEPHFLFFGQPQYFSPRILNRRAGFVWPMEL